MSKRKRGNTGNKRAAKVERRKKRKEQKALHFDTVGETAVFTEFEHGGLPDRRAMEGVMQRALGGLAGGQDLALRKAQELMYDAFDEPSLRKARKLALQAISISPDCADAYVFLAEQADTDEEAINLYEEGLAAGRRAIGDEFDELVGHFWGVLHTRPYMRARLGVAQWLEAHSRDDEAADHYREMLRLNPNDNQGVRELLASLLLLHGKDDELAALLHQYEDDCSATWAYTKAVSAFRSGRGDCDEARSLLSEAIELNPHVPAYLTGRKPLPRELPEYVTWRGESEAFSYVVGFLRGWKATPGAIAWLRKIAEMAADDVGDDSPDQQERDDFLARQLAKLPATDDAWCVAVRPLPIKLFQEDDADDDWALLAFSHDQQGAVGLDHLSGAPGADDVWQALARFMRDPYDGTPRRPQSVEFLSEELCGQLCGRLRAVGIEAEVREDAAEMTAAFDELLRHAAPAVDEEEIDDGRELIELPLATHERWQIDVGQQATWIRDEGETVRPWAVMVTDPDEGFIIQVQLETEPPDAEAVWKWLERAMRRPSVGEPRRPGRIQVRSNDHVMLLEPKLGPLGIACEVGDLGHWDSAFQDMSNTLNQGNDLTALVDAPGAEVEQVGRFFEAAAAYYRRTPWRKIPGDTVLEVKSKLADGGTCYAVVMGQQGMTLGLALYYDFEQLEAILTGEFSDAENAERTTGMSLTYGEEFEMAVSDLDAAEQFGWPVAAPEAYPSVMKIDQGSLGGPPSPEELALLEGCLRAIPDLVANASKKSRRVMVAVGDGKAAVTVRRMV